MRPRPPRRPPLRTFTVLRKSSVTPRMLRLTIGGPGMEDFPDDQAGASIKLVFPDEAGEKRLRTYTIRAQRPGELDIDVVLHDGLASNWARACEPGDSILVGGPGKRSLVSPGAWYLLASDMAGLPALSVNLERLPDDAKGIAVIEVDSTAEIQPLDAPKDVALRWIVRREPGTTPEALLHGVQCDRWPPGKPGVWVAGEFESMSLLRELFRDHPAVDRHLLYVSSYWKRGRNEDQHERLKRAQAESAA